ncbi:hypothetical protein [Luteimonas sp. R10]|uniref:hypothetical protein n=1 Tax=Luteimonas sp. R10 TaxID=3108176 RepID=UPI00308AD507|nr:hypothetical protein U3649_10975 [Luteimonas sp. R10]
MNMKNAHHTAASTASIAAACLLALACVAGPAAASDGGCRLQLSDTTLDYGRMGRSELIDRTGASGEAALGNRTLVLGVSCREASAMRLGFQGVAADENGFKFADHGRFTLRLKDARIDGQPVLLRSDPALPASASVLLRPGDQVESLVAGHPVKGRQLSVQVEVETEVTVEATRVREETTWQGSGSFVVHED